MSEIYDISPLVSSQSATFPLDVPYSREVSLDFKKGDHLTLSSITTTVHVGAHADAPVHYHADGETIDQRDVNLYVGECEVVEINVKPGNRIYPTDIGSHSFKVPRVLFKTNSFPDPDKWTNDFNSLSPELIDYLADQGVRLIGIDTPSVDPHDSKGLESHQAIYKNNFAILEGIVLENVPEGVYKLIALPLRLKDSDASPVRAILVKSFDIFK